MPGQAWAGGLGDWDMVQQGLLLSHTQENSVGVFRLSRTLHQSSVPISQPWR